MSHTTWCKRKCVKPRFGAVGKCGSIAVVERFIAERFGCSKQAIYDALKS